MLKPNEFWTLEDTGDQDPGDKGLLRPTWGIWSVYEGGKDYGKEEAQKFANKRGGKVVKVTLVKI